MKLCIKPLFVSPLSVWQSLPSVCTYVCWFFYPSLFVQVSSSFENFGILILFLCFVCMTSNHLHLISFQFFIRFWIKSLKQVFTSHLNIHIFFDIAVMVYPLNTSAHFRNDCLTPFQYLLGLWCCLYSYHHSRSYQPRCSEEELNTRYCCVRIKYTLSVEVVRKGTRYKAVLA